MDEKRICSEKLLFAEGHFSRASGHCISMLNAPRVPYVNISGTQIILLFEFDSNEHLYFI